MKKQVFRGIISILLTAFLVAAVWTPAFAESEGPGSEDGFDSGFSSSVGDGGDAGLPEEDDPPGKDLPEARILGEETPAYSGYEFPGMAAGYTLSAAERGDKKQLTEKGVVRSFSETTAGKDYVEGEVVFFADSRDFAEQVAQAYGGELKDFAFGVAVATLPGVVSTFEAITAAADLGNDLPAVYPNFLYKLPEPIVEKKPVAGGGVGAFVGETVPVKPVWSPSFGDPFLNNPNAGYEGYQWFHDAIGTYAAWGTTMGAGITVAVIDTGVQDNHPDIGTVGGTGTNTSGVGDDPPVGPTTNTDDALGHGTHVAGIIAANANTIGGRGVAPLATILPVKVFDDTTKEASTAAITAGISWVMNESPQPADIISMSLGGYDIDVGYANMVKAAIDLGIVVVAAAGNDGTTNQPSPAVFPDVICVGATDMNGLRVFFSNYGPQVTISAPGYNILSTYPTALTSSLGAGFGYEVMSGTSMATPVVSGAIALYLSTLPPAARPTNKAGVTNVKNAIVKQATAAGSPSIGKIVNVGNMFNAVTTVPAISVYDSSGMTKLDPKGLIPNNGIVKIDGSNYIVYTTDGSNPAVKNGVVTNGTGTAGDSVSIGGSSTPLPVGKVVIKALCVNGQGTVSKAASLTITTVNNAPGPKGYKSGGNGVSPISGPAYLSPGKAGTYSASVTASAPAGSKTVAWSISDGQTLANIDQKGKLTVNTGISTESPLSTVTIRATQSGNSSVYSEYEVCITPIMTSLSVSFPAGVTKLAVGGATDADSNSVPATCNLSATAGFSDSAQEQGDDTIGYLLWSSNKPKIAAVDPYTGTVTALTGGTAVITAKATDGSGLSFSISVPCVQPATGVVISGSNKQIAAGGSLTLKAATVPAKPTVGGVTWTVTGPTGVGVTNGKLTVPAGVTSETVVVTAKANDGFGASSSVSIDIVPSKTTKVTIGTSQSFGRTSSSGKTVIPITAKNGNAVTVGPNNNVVAVQLFTVNPTSKTDFDWYATSASQTINNTTIALSGNAVGNTSIGSNFVWSSNKPAVASVDPASGLVTAVSAGSAVITCLASDGSGKKATCSVNVGVPASSLWLQGKKPLSLYGDLTLAFGKSLPMSAAVYSSYGKVSNAKVNWSYEISLTPNLSDLTPVSRPNTLYSKIKLSAAGNLTTDKSLLATWWNDIRPNMIAVTVTATAADGSGVSDSVDVFLCPGTDVMVFWPEPDSLADDGVSNIYWSSTYGPYLAIMIEPYNLNNPAINKLYGNYYGDYIITSSNPSVVAIELEDPGCFYDGDGDFGIPITPLKPGTAVITAVSNDGTGKSAKITVTVTAKWFQ